MYRVSNLLSINKNNSKNMKSIEYSYNIELNKNWTDILQYT